MKKNTEIEDSIFDRLRALERGDSKPDPNEKTFKIIFKKLRKLEEKTEKLNALKLQLIGGAVVLGFLLELWLRLR